MSSATTREITLTADQAMRLERLAETYKVGEGEVIEKALDILFSLSEFFDATAERRALSETLRHRRQGAEQSAREAQTSSFLLAIAGLGASGQGDVAERDEEILAAEVDSVHGWSLT